MNLKTVVKTCSICYSVRSFRDCVIKPFSVLHNALCDASFRATKLTMTLFSLKRKKLYFRVTYIIHSLCKQKCNLLINEIFFSDVTQVRSPPQKLNPLNVKRLKFYANLRSNLCFKILYAKELPFPIAIIDMIKKKTFFPFHS